MDGVILTPLKKIRHPKGDIFHAIKRTDPGFNGFGEAYFSTVNQGDTKGWKNHKIMTLNIIVPVGEVEFVIYNKKTKEFFNISLSTNNYQRLTVSPGLWVAFRGKGANNLLLNLASIEHDPDETIAIEIDKIKYEW